MSRSILVRDFMILQPPKVLLDAAWHSRRADLRAVEAALTVLVPPIEGHAL